MEAYPSRGQHSSQGEVGYNVLSIAILFNAHDIVPLLLERQADHHGPIKQHSTLFHLITNRANATILTLLIKKLAKRDVECQRDDRKIAG